MVRKLTRFLRSGAGGAVLIGLRAAPWDKGMGGTVPQVRGARGGGLAVRFPGQKNAGAKAPLFSSRLSKAENVAEIMPGGRMRHRTTLTDPASSLNGRSVSVSDAEGLPDFSPLGAARVAIPNPVRRAAARLCAGLCRGCTGSRMINPCRCSAQITAWLQPALPVIPVIRAQPHPKGRAGAGA